MSSQAHIVNDTQHLAPLNIQTTCCPSACWQHLASPLQAQALAPVLSFGLPTALTGLRILLLGEGNGQEIYCLAHQTGAAGEVFAVTSSGSSLTQWRQWHSEFCRTHGFDNLSLLLSDDQHPLPLAETSFDLIISLETHQNSLLFDASYLRTLLKTGGEWLRLKAGPIAHRPAGFVGPFSLASSTETNAYKANRWFKLPPDQPPARTFRLIYNGGIEDSPQELVFDRYHLTKGLPVELPPSIYQVLIHSRYRDYLQYESAAISCGLFGQ